MFERLTSAGDHALNLFLERGGCRSDARLDGEQSGLQFRLLHHGRGDAAQIAGEAGEPQRADEPLRWIPLIPADSVAEIGWESMMEAVISLAEGYQGHQPVVAGRDFAIE